MSKYDWDFRRSDNGKFPERLIISSSVVSRIGSPENNFVEIPNSENFDFSFVDTRTEIESTNNILQTPLSENLNPSQAIILKELESLRMQVKMINKKLDYNLTVLKEKEEKNKLLTKIVNSKNDTTKIEKSMLEEVNCSCSKGCILF
ncbi:hypothetical protein SteCoe_8053 [Stentor coeruleus]|uniref:Uncharacterized protein n=1 Tax=Stentor coeruleus TaxID=5963 RepID=A0A1R2CL65_9CILI|nr:hypothetical protein SteCoe_35086 [Stentor coeruleus]OMJ89690.1 hypothetical protein SteCoe_8053 [Stentor coeruleus]